MANSSASGSSIELVPRRIVFCGLGAVGAMFVLPGCAENAPPKAASDEAAATPAPATAPAAATDAPAAAAAPTVTANPAWEDEAKKLEAMGQGLYSAKATKDQPGKEGTHVPKVMLAGDKVSLSTTHPTEAPSDKKPTGHHITHHYLRDGKTGLVFAWKTFELKPGETAASDFTLPAGVTAFTAFQVCNLHWTWTTEPQAKG